MSEKINPNQLIVRGGPGLALITAAVMADLIRKPQFQFANHNDSSMDWVDFVEIDGFVKFRASGLHGAHQADTYLIKGYINTRGDERFPRELRGSAIPIWIRFNTRTRVGVATIALEMPEWWVNAMNR